MIKYVATIALSCSLLAGCTDQPRGSVRDTCGDPPPTASYTVSYVRTASSWTAVLPQADFASLVVERDAMRDWAMCVADLEVK